MRASRSIVPVAVALLAACGALAGVSPAGGQSAATATSPALPPPLAIGLTESDPRLLVPGGRTSRVARAVVALRPSYVRVLVPWERLQPSADRRPNWDAPALGCPRINPGCRSDRGLRAQLQAIKQRQDADGGWKILAVPYFTPLWAVAGPPEGCQRTRQRHARAQMPRIGAYRMFLRRLNALADKVGVKIDYIAPWNEPNHPAFLQPQRMICDVHAKAASPAAYARLVRAAEHERRDGQTIVVGSLAGLEAPRTYGASAAEFVRGLPHDVACAGGPFVQHAYVGPSGRHGRPAPRADPVLAASDGLLDGVLAALDAKRCPAVKQLWIGETGAFDHRCQAMSAALRSWAGNDRVDAAFQYTFRESRDYPVGLVSSSLRTRYPSYRAWLAFAGAPAAMPADPC